MHLRSKHEIEDRARACREESQRTKEGFKGVPKKVPSGVPDFMSRRALCVASKPAVMLIKLANLVLLANLVGAVPLPAKIEELNTLDATTDPPAISDATATIDDITSDTDSLPADVRAYLNDPGHDSQMNASTDAAFETFAGSVHEQQSCRSWCWYNYARYCGYSSCRGCSACSRSPPPPSPSPPPPATSQTVTIQSIVNNLLPPMLGSASASASFHTGMLTVSAGGSCVDCAIEPADRQHAITRWPDPLPAASC